MKLGVRRVTKLPRNRLKDLEKAAFCMQGGLHFNISIPIDPRSKWGKRILIAFAIIIVIIVVIVVVLVAIEEMKNKATVNVSVCNASSYESIYFEVGKDGSTLDWGYVGDQCEEFTYWIKWSPDVPTKTVTFYAFSTGGPFGSQSDNETLTLFNGDDVDIMLLV